MNTITRIKLIGGGAEVATQNCFGTTDIDCKHEPARNMSMGIYDFYRCFRIGYTKFCFAKHKLI